MKVAVFCGASVPRNGIYVEAARRLGRVIAECGCGLVYGGSNLGLMGEVSGAALGAGGHVTGIIPTLFSEEIIASQPVSELVRVESMGERKRLIISMSDLFIALPGGIGTVDEVSEVMVANQLGTVRGGLQRSASGTEKPIILLNIEGFYDALIAQLQLIKDEGFMRSDAGLRVVRSVDEVEALLRKLTVEG